MNRGAVWPSEQQIAPLDTSCPIYASSPSLCKCAWAQRRVERGGWMQSLLSGCSWCACTRLSLLAFYTFTSHFLFKIATKIVVQYLDLKQLLWYLQFTSALAGMKFKVHKKIKKKGMKTKEGLLRRGGCTNQCLTQCTEKTSTMGRAA